MLIDFYLLFKNPHLRPRILSRLIGWTLSSMVGWAAAGWAGLPIGRVIVVEGGMAALYSAAGTMSMIGALIGGLIGIGQWMVLRRGFTGMIWWLVATAVGWGLGLPGALILNSVLQLGITAGLFGLIVGALVSSLQWLLCSRTVPDFRRWLVINLVGYVFGLTGSGWLERQLLIATQGLWGASPWQTALTASFAGLIVGLSTGIVIVVVLLRELQPTNASNDYEESA